VGKRKVFGSTRLQDKGKHWVLESCMPKQLSASLWGICYLSPERFLR